MVGQIRIKTLLKALAVYNGSIERNRILKVHEIVQAIHGKKANAYNYQRFLKHIFPPGPIDPNRPVGDEQRCLM